MKKEIMEEKRKAILILIIMVGLFFSFAPFQDFMVSIFNEDLQGFEQFIGQDLVQNLKDWDFYMTSQWFGKNFGQFVPIIAIILSFSLFSREFESGTIEFLLVRLPRKKVFLNKLVGSLAILLIILSVLSFLPSIYSLVVSKNFKHILTLKFMVHVLFGAFFWYSISILMSVLFDSQVKSLITSFLLLAITTILGLIKPLGFLNTYKYILGSDIFGGQINWIYSFVILIIGILCIFFSYCVFKNKEA